MNLSGAFGKLCPKEMLILQNNIYKWRGGVQISNLANRPHTEC